MDRVMHGEVASPFRSREQRAEDRERRREAVMSAAVRLFNAKGFHAASVDELATELGVGKPTIYHYIGNKEQVLFECISRGLEQLRLASRELENTTGTGLERLRCFLRLYGGVILSDYGRLIVRTSDEFISSDKLDSLRSQKAEVDAAIRHLIEVGIRDGSIEPGNPHIIAFTVAGALNWAGRWHDPAGPYNAGDTISKIVDTLTGGLARRVENGMSET